MKKCIFPYIMVFYFCFLFSLAPQAISPTAKMAEDLCKAIPTEFGYIDNTEYHRQCYFKELPFVDDCCIMINADSTNFNEIGIFHVKNKRDAKLCEKQVAQYLTDMRDRFMNGVIYDIDEYPKFENATTVTINDFVFYVILSPEQKAAALTVIQTMVKE